MKISDEIEIFRGLLIGYFYGSVCPQTRCQFSTGRLMDGSDLIELPTTQASKATFPPGCCVWILPAISCESHGDGCDVHQELVMSEGKVLSVFLGDVFSSSSKIYYKLVVAGGCGTLLVEEARLVFAKNMPVLFLPTTENQRPRRIDVRVLQEKWLRRSRCFLLTRPHQKVTTLL